MSAKENQDREKDVFDGFSVDHSGALPVWIQLKNRIAHLITSGRLEPKAQLPTVRKFAVDLDISYNTVNRAYMSLEREGFITTRKGRGTFVADFPASADGPDESINMLADQLIHAARAAGMGREDILGLVEGRFDR